ncbi:hypothetical protein BJ912DRAFT_992848 [Pholiota molesta]|nr:hypothetical protein BJ912DRAFT_992848 [Pholiota molesta]
MILKLGTSFVGLFALAEFATAQTAGAWNKCGGIGYSGPTTCIPDWVCVYQNPYNSQCLQPDSSTATATTTSTSSADGPSAVAK